MKVLFIINGLGLGNSTRCDAIIEQLLKRQAIVDIATSGNGVAYFQDKRLHGQLYPMCSISYGKSRVGKLSILRTMLSLPQMLNCYFRNVVSTWRVISKNKYDVVVIDSEYSMLFLKPFFKGKIVAINNSDMVLHYCRKITLPLSTCSQYLVEIADNLFHRLVPDLVLAPTLIPFKSGAKVIHLAPLVRDGLIQGSVRPSPVSILAMLSGSSFGTQTHFLKAIRFPEHVHVDVVGREGFSTSQMTFHGKKSDNAAIINNADIMIINGGFSAVSEAVVLGKPCIILPIENHAEQLVNALIVEELGLGLVASEEDIALKVEELLHFYSDFLSRHKKLSFQMDAASKAAQLIEEAISI